MPIINNPRSGALVQEKSLEMYQNRNIIRLLAPAILIGLLCPLRIATERTRVVEQYPKTEVTKVKVVANAKYVWAVSSSWSNDDTSFYAFISSDNPKRLNVVFIPYETPADAMNFGVLYQIRFNESGEFLESDSQYHLAAKALPETLNYTATYTGIIKHLRNDGTVEKTAQTESSSFISGWLGSKDSDSSLFDSGNTKDNFSFITVLLVFLILATLLIGQGLRRSKFSYGEKQQLRSPSLAPYLLKFFLSSDEELESIIGDLLEEYSEFNSITKARSWLYRQVLASVLPLVLKKLRNRLASYFGKRVH